MEMILHIVRINPRLEGLLPIASTEKKGLKPEYEVNILNIDIAMTESGKYTKITSKSSNVTLIWKRTQYNGIPEIIFISRGNYSSISSGIATRLNNKYLTKPNIYVDISGALYLQVDYSNYAQNCIFNLLGSSPISNEGEVELPSDATRIEVNDII